MGREAQRATVHGARDSETTKQLSMHTIISDIKHILMCLLVCMSICLLLKNVCLCLLPILFYWDVCFDDFKPHGLFVNFGD